MKQVVFFWLGMAVYILGFLALALAVLDVHFWRVLGASAVISLMLCGFVWDGSKKAG